MSEAVKVGQRVKATCGESVIVGTVAYSVLKRDAGIHVSPAGQTMRTLTMWLPFEIWQVEVIPDPTPTWAMMNGRVCRDNEGELWRLRPNGHWRGGSAYSGFYDTFSALLRDHGPLTPLYTEQELRAKIADDFDRLAGQRNPVDPNARVSWSAAYTHVATRIREPELFSGVSSAVRGS